MMLLCPLLPTHHCTLVLFKEAQVWFQSLGESSWMRPASGGWTSPLPCPAFSHRWVWFFSRPELSRQAPPKSPECQPFLMIEYLVYEKDLSLNTNICILLDRTKEPGPARRILDLTTAEGTRGLWLSHADSFPWSGHWSQSRHHFVHFSGNLSHYKIKKTRKLSK